MSDVALDAASPEDRKAWMKKNLHSDPCEHCQFIRDVIALLDEASHE